MALQYLAGGWGGGALLNLNGLRCGASNPRSITGVVKIMVAMDIINTPGILSNDSMETV